MLRIHVKVNQTVMIRKKAIKSKSLQYFDKSVSILFLTRVIIDYLSISDIYFIDSLVALTLITYAKTLFFYTKCRFSNVNIHRLDGILMKLILGQSRLSRIVFFFNKIVSRNK